MLSCLNASFYIASRVLYVLAEKGDAPRFLVATNSRYVPARSVWLASFAGFIGVIAAILSPGIVFAWLVKATGAIIIVIYVMICISQVRLRRARERAGQPAPQLPMWLFPWATYFAIAAMVAVLLKMAFDPKMASEFWASVASIAAALIAYFIKSRRTRSADAPRPPATAG